IFVIAVSALVSMAMVGAGALMPTWVFSTVVLGAGVGGFLLLWNKARTRIVFELLADRLYLARVGPLSRRQQVWARETLEDIAVWKIRERKELDDPTVTW